VGSGGHASMLHPVCNGANLAMIIRSTVFRPDTQGGQRNMKQERKRSNHGSETMVATTHALDGAPLASEGGIIALRMSRK